MHLSDPVKAALAAADDDTYDAINDALDALEADPTNFRFARSLRRTDEKTVAFFDWRHRGREFTIAWDRAEDDELRILNFGELT